MPDDKREIQRRYKHVRDLHERAKAAVLYGTDSARAEVGISSDHALDIAAEYFEANDEYNDRRKIQTVYDDEWVCSACNAKQER